MHWTQWRQAGRALAMKGVWWGRGRSRVLVPWRQHPIAACRHWGQVVGGCLRWGGALWGGNRKMMVGRERNLSGTGGLCRTHRETSCVPSYTLCGALSARVPRSFSVSHRVGRVGILSPMSPRAMCSSDLQHHALPNPGRVSGTELSAGWGSGEGTE